MGACGSALFGVGFCSGGCMQSTLEPASEANLKPRDKKLLANAPYEQAAIPEPYRATSSTITARKRPARSWSIPTRAISITCCRTARRSATASPSAKKRWRGRASPRSAAWKNGRPGRRPPASRSGSATCRASSAAARTIRWARARIYLFDGNKDTLYRIHGTNQPEYIGQAISSGCIRLTNEDVIDLYNRVKIGTMVVVLAPEQGDSPFNPRLASTGGSVALSNAASGAEKRRLRAPLFCSA